MRTFDKPLTKKHREELEGIVANSTLVFRVIIFMVFVVNIGIFFRGLQSGFDWVELQAFRL